MYTTLLQLYCCTHFILNILPESKVGGSLYTLTLIPKSPYNGWYTSLFKNKNQHRCRTVNIQFYLSLYFFIHTLTHKIHAMVPYSSANLYAMVPYSSANFLIFAKCITHRSGRPGCLLFLKTNKNFLM